MLQSKLLYSALDFLPLLFQDVHPHFFGLEDVLMVTGVCLHWKSNKLFPMKSVIE